MSSLAATLAAVVGAHSPTKKQKILIVDDERLIADSLARILADCGFDIRTAYDGASALELSCSFHPDCLITDLLMPGMTGIELAVRLRERFGNCRVILFSGQAYTQHVLSQAREYHFELLTKPVNPVDLLAHLQAVA